MGGLGPGADPRLRVLFGGTFDPPTLAHWAAAEAFHKACDHVVTWVPNYVSPLKQRVGVAHHREAMLKQLIDPDPRFDLSLIELNQPGPSYTVDTLARLRAEDPDQTLIWCMGADSFSSIQQWGQWTRLLELASLMVVARPGSPLHAPDIWISAQCRPSEIADAPHGRWCEIPMRVSDLASSQVRDAIQNARPWMDQVAHKTAQYIKDHRLYVDDHG